MRGLCGRYQHLRVKDKLNDMKQEREQRKQDKTKKPLKFGRDLESDWTKRKKTPLYRIKEHASVDVNSGLVMSTLYQRPERG